MKFKQKCMICEKATIEGGSNIDTNVFTQFKAFVKTAKAKGWHVVKIEENGMEFICPFCNRRMLKALEQRMIKGDF